MSDAETPRSFGQLKLFTFFMFGSLALLMPFLPIYFQQAGFNNVQIGLLMSVGPIISIIANPFWGFWSDRLQNTRLIIMIMLIGNLVLSQFFFQMNGFVLVFTFMMLFYFFQSALNPIGNSLILHAIEKTKYQFGTFRLWGSIGFALMVVVSSPFIEWLGIDKLGYIYAVMVILTIALSFRLPQHGKKSKSASFSGREMVKVLTNGYFLTFLILGILISIPNRMNSTFISIYISQLGGSELYVGWAWFLAAIAEVPFFILLDRYLKPTPRIMTALLAVVSFLYALRWLLMGIVATPMQVVLLQLMHGFTFGIYFYTGTQLVAYLVPATYRASGQSLYALAWMGISGILAGLMGGLIFDHFGSRFMYGVSSVMSVIGMLGFVLMWLMMRRSREHSVSS